MIKYYIKNIHTGCYVSDNDLGTFYKIDVSYATKFTLAQALKRIQKMKHPENWDVIKVEDKKENEKKSRRIFKKKTSNSTVK